MPLLFSGVSLCDAQGQDDPGVVIGGTDAVGDRSRARFDDSPGLELMPGESPLQSWKEIAAYVGRSERTCRRWETEFQLPVHRMDSSPRP